MSIAFTAIGEGKPLLILHGLYGTGRNWQSVASALSNDYEVFLIDLPNHGSSIWTSEISYEDFSSRLSNFIIEQGLNDPIILGHSLGGKVAMFLALQNPHLVDRLIIVDIAPVNYNSDDQLKVINALSTINIKQIKTRSEADNLLSDNILDPLLRGFLLQNLIRDGDNYDWRCNLKGLKNGMNNIVKFPEIGKEIVFNYPTLFIKGSKSDYILPIYKKKISNLFPCNSFIEIEDAGHWPHIDNKDKVVEAIINFLE